MLNIEGMKNKRIAFVIIFGILICILVWSSTLTFKRTPIDFVQPVNIDKSAVIDSKNPAPETISTLKSGITPKLRQTASTVVSKFQHSESPNLKTLIDLTNFQFLINQFACNASLHLPLVLVVVHSAPKNLKKRETLRETWANHNDPRARILFLLGTVKTKNLQQSLEEENNKYHDIIQGSFVDNYVNMTYKHVMALKWHSHYCSEVGYLLKVDDDVFIHLLNLYKYISNIRTPAKNLILCFSSWNLEVQRSKASKWYVETKDYTEKYYPPYCQGYSILYTSDVVRRLYNESDKHKYFWIDDVHVTGTLAQSFEVNITHFGEFYLNGNERINISNGNKTTNSDTFIFTTPNLSEQDIRLLWNGLIKQNETEPATSSTN